MNLRQTRTATNALFAAIFGSIFLGYLTNTEIFFLLSLVSLAGLCVIQLLFCRCPHCKKSLISVSGNFCPHCGKSVADEPENR